MGRKSLIILVVVGVLVGTLLLGSLGCGKSTSAPSVTTNAASNVAANSATLNGNLTSLGSASSVTVSFEWEHRPGGMRPTRIWTTAQVMTNSGTFSFDLSGLTPGTQYYFWAKAVGSKTVYGAQEIFTTSGRADIVFTSSYSLAHSHEVPISPADIDNPPAGGRTITTTAEIGSSNRHSHTITLSQQDYQTIQSNRHSHNGGTVTVTTSLVLDHTHTFTIL